MTRPKSDPFLNLGIILMGEAMAALGNALQMDFNTAAKTGHIAHLLEKAASAFRGQLYNPPDARTRRLYENSEELLAAAEGLWGHLDSTLREDKAARLHDVIAKIREKTTI